MTAIAITHREAMMRPKAWDEYYENYFGVQGSLHSVSSDESDISTVEALRQTVEEITGRPVKRESFGFIKG